MSFSSINEAISNAIATQEGYYAAAPNLSQQNNNPGNLVYAPWEASLGGQPGAGGFASFPDPQSGYTALQARVQQLVNGGASIASLLKTWAGPQYAGNTQASYNSYVSNVASATGLDPNVPIAAAGTTAAAETSGGDAGEGSGVWEKVLDALGLTTDVADITVRGVSVVVGIVVIFAALLYLVFSQFDAVAKSPVGRAAKRAGEVFGELSA